ncbi:MAG: DUF1501 domain-containing protein [Pirellulales bacterium]
MSGTESSRRQFLLSTAGLSLVALAPQVPPFLAAAAEQAGSGEQAADRATSDRAAADRVLVVVQLTGGNDGLNTVVPFRDERYRQARPTLALPENQLSKLNADLGLHPSLRGFARLWEAGELAILQGVGYPNPNRSHFESLDIWHTARREAPGRTAGWLGRYLDATLDAQGELAAQAIHVGSEVQPLALTATRGVAASLRSAEELRFAAGPTGDRWQAAWEASAGAGGKGDDLLSFVRTVSVSARNTSRQLEQAASRRGGTPVSYPETDLGHKLQTVGQLIDSGLPTRVYYVMLDGFDTHAAQPAAHAGLLQQLGDAVSAFRDDLTRRGHQRRVLLMAFSEFGRRVAENASQGTDHGAAAPVFLTGATVQGGLVGAHPSLTDLDDGDLKHHTDFRRIYAGLLSRWLGIPSGPLVGDEFAPLTVWS